MESIELVNHWACSGMKRIYGIPIAHCCTKISTTDEAIIFFSYWVLLLRLLPAYEWSKWMNEIKENGSEQLMLINSWRYTAPKCHAKGSNIQSCYWLLLRCKPKYLFAPIKKVLRRNIQRSNKRNGVKCYSTLLNSTTCLLTVFIRSIHYHKKRILKSFLCCKEQQFFK